MQEQVQAKKPNRLNMVKWSLGCAGLGMILFAGLTMMVLIVSPIVFQSLMPEQQAKLVKHFPFMVSFQPTHPYQFLPTPITTNSNALALLSTSQSFVPTA